MGVKRLLSTTNLWKELGSLEVRGWMHNVGRAGDSERVLLLYVRDKTFYYYFVLINMTIIHYFHTDLWLRYGYVFKETFDVFWNAAHTFRKKVWWGWELFGFYRKFSCTSAGGRTTGLKQYTFADNLDSPYQGNASGICVAMCTDSCGEVDLRLLWGLRKWECFKRLRSVDICSGLAAILTRGTYCQDLHQSKFKAEKRPCWFALKNHWNAHCHVSNSWVGFPNVYNFWLFIYKLIILAFLVMWVIRWKAFLNVGSSQMSVYNSGRDCTCYL